MYACSVYIYLYRHIIFTFKPYANWLEHFAAAVSSFSFFCNCSCVVVFVVVAGVVLVHVHIRVVVVVAASAPDNNYNKEPVQL